MCALKKEKEKNVIKNICYLVQKFAIWATPVSSYLLKQRDGMSVITGWIFFFFPAIVAALVCMPSLFSWFIVFQICQLAIMTTVKNS